MSNFHGRIMNIQQDGHLLMTAEQSLIYKTGHKDARHAAAEIALEADRRIEELEAFINACLDCTSADEVHDFLVNNWEEVLGDESSLSSLGDPWSEDPEFPVADWQYEVQNNDTRLGYHEWVEHRKEAK